MLQGADRLFRRYMSCLGWIGDPGLFELVRTHLIKVPVENVSAILRASEGLSGIPDVEAFLGGIERYDLGGGALTNNGYFVELLRYLDYDVELLGADLNGAPMMHAVVQVLHEGRPHLVDVGLGAPFYEPIPLDAGLPYRAQSGDLSFTVAKHADAGCFEVSCAAAGVKRSSYVIRPTPRRLGEFEAAIEAAYAPVSPALRHLEITRIFASRRASLSDDVVTLARHELSESRKLADLAALEASLHEDFQLHNLPIGRAVAALRGLGGALFGG